mmetsp:Transcript_385/g.655  ORF Transcript_385/g.655 Transcript_385/m.655 type:complete len:126 (+) Transcript_385:1028-1405(+)
MIQMLGDAGVMLFGRDFGKRPIGSSGPVRWALPKSSKPRQSLILQRGAGPDGQTFRCTVQPHHEHWGKWAGIVFLLNLISPVGRNSVWKIFEISSAVGVVVRYNRLGNIGRGIRDVKDSIQKGTG